MTPDYGRMARGFADLGAAAVRTELRLLERWLGLVADCGARFGAALDAADATARAGGGSISPGGVAAAAGEAARDYLRGAASLPELAVLDLYAELDAIRRQRNGEAAP